MIAGLASGGGADLLLSRPVKGAGGGGGLEAVVGEELGGERGVGDAVDGVPRHGKPAKRTKTYRYSIHAFKRSAIKQRLAFKRRSKSATQLLFPIHIVTFKQRIAVSRT